MESTGIPPSFLFGRCGTTMWLVFARKNASDAEWSRWVRAYSDAAVEHGVRGLIVVSRGGGPNARQQNEVRTALAVRLEREALDIRTAVCSDHLAARLITRAIGWLSGAIYIESFGYRERLEALRYLGVAEQGQPEILATLESAESDLSAASVAQRRAPTRSGRSK